MLVGVGVEVAPTKTPLIAQQVIFELFSPAQVIDGVDGETEVLGSSLPIPVAHFECRFNRHRSTKWGWSEQHINRSR